MSRRRHRKPGIYLYRTDKPGAIWGLPIIGRHNGYVGETWHERHRDRQHLIGGGQYNAVAKPWADLRPRRYLLRLPWWTPKFALHALEALAIWALLPVYNDKLNLANPRRISLRKAKLQRAARDAQRGRRALRTLTAIRPAHVLFLLALVGGLTYLGAK